MSLNDWTRAINHWMNTRANAPGELERGQAALLLGSCLTIMRNELATADYVSVLRYNALSESAAQVYRARFAGFAVVREEAAIEHS